MALPLLLVLSLMALVIGSAPAMALTTISKGYLGHARQVTSNPGCTYTAFTEPVITEGPTSTSYTLTTYTSQLYDCDGCSNVDVLQLGHVFQEISFTITVTATNATTSTIAKCSPTPTPTPALAHK